MMLSVVARVSRTNWPKSEIESVATGKVSAAAHSPRLLSPRKFEIGGSSPISIENIRTSTVAVKNSGKEIEPSVIQEIALSVQVPGYIAARSPAPKESGTAMIATQPARMKV